MPKNRYVISATAKQDLKQIAKYTIENFGGTQSLRYAQGLRKVLEELAENPQLGKNYVAVKDRMLLRYRFTSHVIFYYKSENGIFIVRVLGGRMDFSRYLK
ncbi:MAG: type II toxin-antitoxin system RelE/ParE family toxin [Bacteroidota bacterium]